LATDAQKRELFEKMAVGLRAMAKDIEAMIAARHRQTAKRPQSTGSTEAVLVYAERGQHQNRTHPSIYRSAVWIFAARNGHLTSQPPLDALPARTDPLYRFLHRGF
jgi:hypothetical protein